MKQHVLTIGEVTSSVRESQLAQKFNVILVVAFIAKGHRRRGDPEQFAMRRETHAWQELPSRKVVNSITQKYREADTPFITLWFDCSSKREEARLFKPAATYVLMAGLQNAFRAALGMPPITNAFKLAKSASDKEKNAKRAAATMLSRARQREAKKKENQLAVA